MPTTKRQTRKQRLRSRAIAEAYLAMCYNRASYAVVGVDGLDRKEEVVCLLNYAPRMFQPTDAVVTKFWGDPVTYFSA